MPKKVCLFFNLTNVGPISWLSLSEKMWNYGGVIFYTIFFDSTNDHPYHTYEIPCKLYRGLGKCRSENPQTYSPHINFVGNRKKEKKCSEFSYNALLQRQTYVHTNVNVLSFCYVYIRIKYLFKYLHT